MKSNPFFGLLLFSLCIFLGLNSLVSPITNSIADQIRCATVTLVNYNQQYTLNTWIQVNATYNRPFPNSVPYTWTVSVVSFDRTIVSSARPVHMYLGITNAYQGLLSLGYMSIDSLILYTRVCYFVMNNNYTSTSFNNFCV